MNTNSIGIYFVYMDLGWMKYPVDQCLSMVIHITPYMTQYILAKKMTQYIVLDTLKTDRHRW